MHADAGDPDLTDRPVPSLRYQSNADVGPGIDVHAEPGRRVIEVVTASDIVVVGVRLDPGHDGDRPKRDGPFQQELERDMDTAESQRVHVADAGAQDPQLETRSV